MATYKIEDSIVFDTKLYTLTRLGSAEVRLSQKEAEVLAVLCIYSGQTVSRQFLFDSAWPNGTGSDGHLNRVILLLRRKFDVLGASDAIKTIPKVGYILNHCTTQYINNDDNPLLIESALEFTLNDNMSNQFNQTTIESETHVEESKVGEKMEEPPFIKNGEPLSHLSIKTPNKSSTPFHWTLKKNSKQIQKWRRVIYISLALSLFICGYAAGFLIVFGENEPAELKYAKVKTELVKNISFNSSSAMDDILINKAKKLLLNWNNNASGNYYIGFSASAISILYFSERGVPLSKRIFFSQGNYPLSLLECALDDSTSRPLPTEKTSNNNVVSIISKKGTVIRNFTTEIIAECEGGNTLPQFNKMFLSVATVVNDGNDFHASKGNFFHSDFKVWSYNGEAILNLGLSGEVSTQLMLGDLYDIWIPKEKTVRAFDSGAQAELEPALKLMTDLITRDEFFSSIEIDDGVYYIDLLGGVLISTK